MGDVLESEQIKVSQEEKQFEVFPLGWERSASSCGPKKKSETPAEIASIKSCIKGEYSISKILCAVLL